MSKNAALELRGLSLRLPDDARPLGTRVLAGIVEMAERAISKLQALQVSGDAPTPAAVIGRIRGTGRGISSSRLIDELERQHPITLTTPFEGSDRVSGGVWTASELLNNGSQASVAKLRWESRAVDLPMHVHDHSDRFIIVHKGRGFFHVTGESADEFTGTKVRSIPARERDIFLFTRGVVHTFSTDHEPMTLLSCQLPFMAFDDPRQYRLPSVRWTAAEHRDEYPLVVGCDAAWSLINGC